MTPEPHDHATTHFGDQSVPTAQKRGLVYGVFDRVADRYDLMNDLMSLGVHRLWKQALVDWLKPQPGEAIIDVAGGTGDIAFRLLDRSRGQVAVTVAEINAGMIAEGRSRAQAGRYGEGAGLTFIRSDAESLSFADKSFDAYTIAFGIRNVTHIEAVLAEAYRVLRPGGRMACLEFSHVTIPGLETLYDTYSERVIPALGSLIADDRAAYQYLIESIRRFPHQGDFAQMIADAGFGEVKIRNLSGGIAALHTGWRI